MTNLFAAAGLEQEAPRPLADRLRPKALAEVAGQDHLVGADGALTRMVARRAAFERHLLGPARHRQDHGGAAAGERDGARIRTAVGDLFRRRSPAERRSSGRRRGAEAGKGTLLFIDEIHRFNRSQQDSFLPYMEDGTITLVGATTENPSFELNPAVLSRASVLVFNRLDEAAMEALLVRAEAAMGRPLPLDGDARVALIGMADGDGRSLLNLADDVFAVVPAGSQPVDRARLSTLVQRRAPLYDKGRDGHYNLISALHKSVRGSDPDAALYWMARMLVAGEDPLFICRRLVRMAVEDIGMADPQALVQTLAAKDAYDFLGSPEGELALAQACIYVATAPKSNATYVAHKASQRAAKETGSVAPPKIILNAPTKLMEAEGYGDGYRYDHDQPDAFSGQNYFPDEMGSRPSYYAPPDRGFEREIKKRLDYWAGLRAKRGR